MKKSISKTKPAGKRGVKDLGPRKTQAVKGGESIVLKTKHETSQSAISNVR